MFNTTKRAKKSGLPLAVLPLSIVIPDKEGCPFPCFSEAHLYHSQPPQSEGTLGLKSQAPTLFAIKAPSYAIPLVFSRPSGLNPPGGITSALPCLSPPPPLQRLSSRFHHPRLLSRGHPARADGQFITRQPVLRGLTATHSGES